MPRLIVTEGAAQGLLRCRRFLESKNDHAAERAGQTIARYLKALESTPAMGRPFDGSDVLREIIIGFGRSGYVGLYSHDMADDAVYISWHFGISARQVMISKGDDRGLPM